MKSFQLLYFLFVINFVGFLQGMNNNLNWVDNNFEHQLKDRQPLLDGARIIVDSETKEKNIDSISIKNNKKRSRENNDSTKKTKQKVGSFNIDDFVKTYEPVLQSHKNNKDFERSTILRCARYAALFKGATPVEADKVKKELGKKF